MTELRSPSLIWVGGALTAVAIAWAGLAGHSQPHLVSGGFLLLASGFAAHRLWPAFSRPFAGHLRAAVLGVLLAPIVVGLDWLAFTGGTAVRIWGWVALAGFAVLLSSHHFVRRFWRTTDRPMLFQLCAEILLMAALIAVSVWEWLFARAAGTPDHRFAAFLLVVTFALLTSLPLVSGIREPHPQFSLLAIASMPAIMAPPLLLYLELAGRSAWPGHVVNVLGWSLLIGGLLYFEVPTRPVPEVIDSLRTTMLTSAIGVMVGVSVASVLIENRVETLTMVMLMISIATMVARDIIQSQRSTRMHEQLRRQALQDPLTTLGNRRALEQWLTGQHSDDSPVSILTIDVDQFKDVNDLLGHHTGDELLEVMADQLTLLATDTGSHVFRMGGDEFVLVCSMPAVEAEAVARRILGVVDRAGAGIPGVSRLALGVSVGVRHVPDGYDHEVLDEAVTQSSQAMRAAKTAGKSRVHVFDDGLQTEYQRRKRVELRLREQLDDVVVHYQPIMDGLRQVVGFEALARWTDPELGVVSPTEFVQVAEHANLIADLGQSILARAVRDMAASGHLAEHRRLNINVSALQLRIPSFVDDVFDVLDGHGLPRHQLVIELTESTSLQPDGPAGLAMQRLAEGGVQLAVDDFGAGATSVGYLSKLPVATVKIDRSLTRTMHEEPTAQLMRGVVQMCRGLQLSVVLEGVETTEQARRASVLGVDHLQGWLFAKAVPLEELEQTMAELAAGVVADPENSPAEDLAQLAEAVTYQIPRQT